MPEKERQGNLNANALNVKGVVKLAGTTLNWTAAWLNGLVSAFGTVAFDRAPKIAIVPLAAVDTAGGALSWANPEAGSIIIHRVVVDVTTKSTGAGTLSVGTTAVSGTTSSANLLDTLDVGTAAGTFDNVSEGGTLGKARQKLAAGKWVTGSKASGALAGLVGNAYIHYHNA